MGEIPERLGRSIQQAPHAWSVALLVNGLVMTGVASAMRGSAEAPGLVTVLVVAMIAYSMFSSLVLLPRFVLPQARERLSVPRAVLLQWTFAVAPFMVGYAGVVIGTEPWTLALGFIASAVLVAGAVRATRAVPNEL